MDIVPLYIYIYIFLDLDIKISEDKFIYKMFDKRDEFAFSVVRMPYIDSNIPSYIFYGTIMSEIIRIARCTLLLDDLIPRLGALFKRMLKQGADSWKILCTIILRRIIVID